MPVHIQIQKGIAFLIHDLGGLLYSLVQHTSYLTTKYTSNEDIVSKQQKWTACINLIYMLNISNENRSSSQYVGMVVINILKKVHCRPIFVSFSRQYLSPTIGSQYPPSHHQNPFGITQHPNHYRFSLVYINVSHSQLGTAHKRIK